MTYATINLLHRLLEEHVDFLDETLQDATRELDETYAVQEADAKEGDKEAEKAINNAADRRHAAWQELTEAQKALDDFVTHDWH